MHKMLWKSCFFTRKRPEQKKFQMSITITMLKSDHHHIFSTMFHCHLKFISIHKRFSSYSSSFLYLIYFSSHRVKWWSSFLFRNHSFLLSHSQMKLFLERTVDSIFVAYSSSIRSCVQIIWNYASFPVPQCCI